MISIRQSDSSFNRSSGCVIPVARQIQATPPDDWITAKDSVSVKSSVKGHGSTKKMIHTGFLSQFRGDIFFKSAACMLIDLLQGDKIGLQGTDNFSDGIQIHNIFCRGSMMNIECHNLQFCRKAVWHCAYRFYRKDKKQKNDKTFHRLLLKY